MPDVEKNIYFLKNNSMQRRKMSYANTTFHGESFFNQIVILWIVIESNHETSEASHLYFLA